MVSHLSTVDCQLYKADLFKKIKSEFKFFDELYFKGHEEAKIKIYFTGSGKDGSLTIGENVQEDL